MKKKKKKLKNYKSIRSKSKRFTAADIQNIRTLSEAIAKIIPYSGFRGNFNLKRIAKDNGLNKFLPKDESNKKESIVEFIKKLHKDRPRTLKKIIREILPKAIERRHKQGNPILAPEAQNLSNQLLKIGIDLKKEIKELNLPRSRPSITPPPYEMQQIIKKFSLHPLLVPDCLELFLDGHINESIRKALEKFEVHIQKKSGNTVIGKDLMAQTFCLKKQVVKLNALCTKSEKNEQEGFMYIAMGIMQWWRNTLSHGDTKQISHHEAIGRLFLISNLLHRLESCIQEKY
ncbi:MAG: TIGR02391 family protein [Candidatus Cloacimonetes bacterium]|nr:TIGR02391 family protein [Candidatus Cloacimonadota bacterium]